MSFTEVSDEDRHYISKLARDILLSEHDPVNAPEDTVPLKKEVSA